MPPVSKAQRRFMHEVLNHPERHKDVPQSVAKEYVDADSPGRKLPERKTKSKSKKGKS